MNQNCADLNSLLSFRVFKVRHLHGEEDRSPCVRAAGGSGGGEAEDGDDGVRLPHGSRNETNLEPIIHSTEIIRLHLTVFYISLK